MAADLTGLTPGGTDATFTWLAHFGAPGALPADGATPLILYKGDGTPTPISITATKLFVNGVEMTSAALTTVLEEWSTSRTLALTEANDYIRFLSSGATTLTIPTNATVAFALGTKVFGRRATGAGAIILSNAGVTVNNSAAISNVAEEGDFTLTKVSTNTWDLDVPVNVANKSLDVDADQTSDIKFPSVKAVFDWAIGSFLQYGWEYTVSFLQNKRYLPRYSITDSAATLTPDIGTGGANVYHRRTQAVGLTINAPIGTEYGPNFGETIEIYIDSVGAQTLTFNSIYKPMGSSFPASTTAGKTLKLVAQFVNNVWKTTHITEV
jgi:hypothetical protein